MRIMKAKDAIGRNVTQKNDRRKSLWVIKSIISRHTFVFTPNRVINITRKDPETTKSVHHNAHDTWVHWRDIELAPQGDLS